VAIALGVVIASVVMCLVVFDWNWLKGPIERAVSNATGRWLTIEGNITGQWRLRPRVRLEQVRFANPARVQTSNLLTAEIVELQIALVPLWRRQVHVLGLLLVKPTLALERIADGRAAAFPFDAFRADFTLKDAQITVDSLEFGMTDRTLRARVALDARKPELAAALVGVMRGVHVAKMVQGKEALGEAAVTLSGSFGLRANGNSVGAILGTADGRAKLLLTDGRVPSLLLAIADLDGARVIASFLGKRPEFVQSSAIDVALQRGVATPAVAVFEAESTVLNPTGSIDLGSELLNLTLVQSPKKASFLSARTPILITGTLRTPAFAPDPVPPSALTAAVLLLSLMNPLAALFATIETGPGEEGSCGEIRRGLRSRSPA
jgi:uncharacterized protein involved in outer membrane biogenesis